MSIFEGSRSTIVSGGIFNATNATYHTTLARPSGKLMIIEESFLAFEADAQRKGWTDSWKLSLPTPSTTQITASILQNAIRTRELP